ncbi:hypothetical protein Anapl_10045 [Anas platyrhynchos]|uniref:Uncharacterized protein n=1 Tax=Anas platyrhynchos TaxID=8839 RepID=R0L8H0_ANAPL|nr:hypothetical protein Anapl_10045 [Anas platyrhynchos]
MTEVQLHNVGSHKGTNLIADNDRVPSSQKHLHKWFTFWKKATCFSICVGDGIIVTQLEHTSIQNTTSCSSSEPERTQVATTKKHKMLLPDYLLTWDTGGFLSTDTSCNQLDVQLSQHLSNKRFLSSSAKAISMPPAVGIKHTRTTSAVRGPQRVQLTLVPEEDAVSSRLTSDQGEGFTLHPEGCRGGMRYDIPNCPEGNVCQYMPKGINGLALTSANTSDCKIQIRSGMKQKTSQIKTWYEAVLECASLLKASTDSLIKKLESYKFELNFHEKTVLKRVFTSLCFLRTVLCDDSLPKSALIHQCSSESDDFYQHVVPAHRASTSSESGRGFADAVTGNGHGHIPVSPRETGRKVLIVSTSPCFKAKARNKIRVGMGRTSSSLHNLSAAWSCCTTEAGEEPAEQQLAAIDSGAIKPNPYPKKIPHNFCFPFTLMQSKSARGTDVGSLNSQEQLLHLHRSTLLQRYALNNCFRQENVYQAKLRKDKFSSYQEQDNQKCISALERLCMLQRSLQRQQGFRTTNKFVTHWDKQPYKP